MNRLLLVDAAQLLDSELLQLQQEPGALSLYADLGEEAQRVGPWLCPYTDLLHRSLDAETAADRRRHQLAVIEADVSSMRLAEHFRRLRELCAASGKRYYFRYADTRALVALHGVLEPAQKVALLGPTSAWSFRARDGSLATLPRDPKAAMSTLPLQLTPQQFSQLRQRSEADALLSELQALRPDLAWDDPGGRGYDWASRACFFLERHAVHDHALSMAVGIKAFESGPAVMDDRRFVETVCEARATVDTRAVLRYCTDLTEAV